MEARKPNDSQNDQSADSSGLSTPGIGTPVPCSNKSAATNARNIQDYRARQEQPRSSNGNTSSNLESSTSSSSSSEVSVRHERGRQLFAAHARARRDAQQQQSASFSAASAWDMRLQSPSPRDHSGSCSLILESPAREMCTPIPDDEEPLHVSSPCIGAEMDDASIATGRADGDDVDLNKESIAGVMDKGRLSSRSSSASWNMNLSSPISNVRRSKPLEKPIRLSTPYVDAGINNMDSGAKRVKKNNCSTVDEESVIMALDSDLPSLSDRSASLSIGLASPSSENRTSILNEAPLPISSPFGDARINNPRSSSKCTEEDEVSDDEEPAAGEKILPSAPDDSGSSSINLSSPTGGAQTLTPDGRAVQVSSPLVSAKKNNVDSGSKYAEDGESAIDVLENVSPSSSDHSASSNISLASPANGKPSPASGKASPASRKPSLASGKPSPSGGKPSLASGKPSPASRKPSLASGKPSPSGGKPSLASGKPSPSGGKPSLASGKPSPASRKPSFASGKPSPACAKPAPASEKSAPASRKSSLVSGSSGKQSLARGKPSPATGKLAFIPNEIPWQISSRLIDAEMEDVGSESHCTEEDNVSSEDEESAGGALDNVTPSGGKHSLLAAQLSSPFVDVEMEHVNSGSKYAEEDDGLSEDDDSTNGILDSVPPSSSDDSTSSSMNAVLTASGKRTSLSEEVPAPLSSPYIGAIDGTDIGVKYAAENSVFSEDQESVLGALDRLPLPPLWFCNVPLFVCLVKRRLNDEKLALEGFTKIIYECASRVIFPSAMEVEENERFLHKCSGYKPADLYNMCARFLINKNSPLEYYKLLSDMCPYPLLLERLVKVYRGGSNRPASLLSFTE
ncbi:treacle protein-like [Paramacrobiotus metropolitanus]|uniref:treacle protein-like n=1 Tax=Paramacrobiotus metropolitanus TaxID=2943436 RepID=UPI002445BDF1|nr:treacle protein-like [Paramacrobiotus metropolitanus]